MPKRPREKGQFRLNRKKVGCTWSAPEDKEENPINNNQEILDYVTKKFGHCDYIIGEEEHKNGKKHFHSFFKFDDELDTTDPHCFDVAGVHPNIINPGQGWPKYCAKTGNYITNFYKKNSFLEASRMGSLTEAMDHLWAVEPKQMCLNAHNIEQNLAKKLCTKQEPTVYYGPYPERYYPTEEEWDPKTHSLLLWGPPGVQKTQFSQYL